MKHYKKIFASFAVLLLVAALAWAATVNKNPYGVAAPRFYSMTYGQTSSLGTYYLEFPTLAANDQFVTEDATQTLTNKTLTGTGIITATNIADVVRYIQLPLTAFVFENTGAPLSTSTTPGLEIDDNLPNVVWADGEQSKILVTFRVPNDYASGGAFKIIATESDSTTPNEIDFLVYVNSNGTAADSSATNQTPVALSGTTATPSEVTLSPQTDFESLAAGSWVTLAVWRDDTATGTGDLEVKGIAFYYTAVQ
jgi:hypothetical protein